MGVIQGGRPLDARRLADQLREYGITSSNLRLADGQVLKGYTHSDFTHAWARYLP